MRVALATAAFLPELDEDGPLLREALDGAGVRARPVVWDDPQVDWAAFELVVLRSVWDYPSRREEFLRWVEGVAAVTTVANPPGVVRWNTDKAYLRDLGAAGVPTVPTVFLPPGTELPASAGEYVLKPTVSAGADETARYGGAGADQEADRDEARAHLARLHAAGRTAMFQPYLASVDDRGETAVLHLGGSYSHAIRKGQILFPGAGVDAMILDKDEREKIEPREPTGAELEVARAALAAVPGGADQLLYARVDLVHDDDGAPRVLELELTEPSLFLGHAPGAAARLAVAVAARA